MIACAIGTAAPIGMVPATTLPLLVRLRLAIGLLLVDRSSAKCIDRVPPGPNPKIWLALGSGKPPDGTVYTPAKGAAPISWIFAPNCSPLAGSTMNDPEIVSGMPPRFTDAPEKM